MAARDAGIDALDLAVGHQLGFFERLLDALDGGVDVHHHATLQAIARGHAQACEFELAIGQHLGHHGHDLGRADVQPHHDVFVFSCHISVCPSLFCPVASAARGYFFAAASAVTVVTPRNRSA